MRLLLAILALLLIGAAPRDWTRTVRASPEGGFVMGNPAARVKVVEYASLTCPHCRTFHQDAMTPLKRDYVAKGLASYEFRNFILNGADTAASILARCGGAGTFFARVDVFYREQPNWVAPFTTIPAAEGQRIRGLPETRQIGAYADAGKLPAFAARHGLTPATSAKCLADAALYAELEKLRGSAEADGVRGTPTFFINGARVTGSSWADVEPQLRKALSR